MKTTALLFPAFAMRYREFDRASVPGFPEEAALYLKRAARLVEIDVQKFESPAEFTLADELRDDLQAHYVTYIDCCAIGSLLRRRGMPCHYVSGYSMGLFAALHHSGAVSFEDGLRLAHATCIAAHEGLQDGTYGMAVVVGLTPEEVRGLIAERELRAEVADICAPRVVISSGRREDLGRLLEAAEEAGSLQARFLPVTAPFHSSFLSSVEGPIRECLDQIEIRDPTCGIVSCVSQRLLLAAGEVREEAARNVWRPMRWFATMNRLLDLGVRVFVECGPSENLCNMARNIERDFRIYHPRKFDRLFASVG